MSAYTFELDLQAYGPEDLDALEGIEREQFLLAAQSETGDQHKKPSDYARALAEELEESPEDQGADRYLVSGGDEDWLFWHFPNTDDGSLFKAASAERVPVLLVQGEFQVHDKRWSGGKAYAGKQKAQLKALASALAEAFDDREQRPRPPPPPLAFASLRAPTGSSRSAVRASSRSKSRSLAPPG